MEKIFIGLFHVSEHVDHFTVIKYFRDKKWGIVWLALPLVESSFNFAIFFKAIKKYAINPLVWNDARHYIGFNGVTDIIQDLFVDIFMSS